MSCRRRVLSFTAGSLALLIGVSLTGCGSAPDAGQSPQSAPSAQDSSLIALPSSDELEAVQGFTFHEYTRWLEDEPSGPSWVAASLTEDQARVSGVGSLAEVEPANCQGVALMAGYGLAADSGPASSIRMVGYGMRRSDSGQAFPTAESVHEWESIAFLMDQGQPEQVVNEALSEWASCAEFTLVGADGQRRAGERAHNFTPERGWAVDVRPAGSAVVRVASMEGPVGARLVNVLEAIGDVLLVTRIGIWSTDPQVWGRAEALYNELADRVRSDERVGQAGERVPVALTQKR